MVLPNKENAEAEIIGNIISKIKHYLPSQAPLKDFIHHNTLHAFQHHGFHRGLAEASTIFGYKVYLSISEYRELFKKGKIKQELLERIISTQKGTNKKELWGNRMKHKKYDESITQNIGQVRAYWKKGYKINMDKSVHAKLFRLVGAFLDQGISISRFPYPDISFLNAIRTIDRKSRIKIFKSRRARLFLQDEQLNISQLLNIIVGDETLYESYLFDQQFAHPGWSGMVNYVEHNPNCLLDNREISLREFIILELLFELDTLDQKYGENWRPISRSIENDIPSYFEIGETKELFEVYALWQEAYEWSYYDSVIKGLQLGSVNQEAKTSTTFQAIFCIDDRSCSIRRHLEKTDKSCETFGTPGFFNIPIFFQPEKGKFFTKLCPAPMTPTHLIREYEAKKQHQKHIPFNRHTYGFFGGLITAPTLGFWSALKMVKSILFPTETDAMVSSFRHMDKKGKLSISKTKSNTNKWDLQVGFTPSQMVDIVEGLLKGIGLVDHFSKIIYLIGHGASSVNNTHYAGYDCGACSGRPGSVNARIAAHMANLKEIRVHLVERGINIPEDTCFIGGLHDTTRDEIEFYDEHLLSKENRDQHTSNLVIFNKALEGNARERARRFLLMNNNESSKSIHNKIKRRSLSLFEPRPEWNHATNSICIIGKRAISKHLFLDRRAFLNSYDFTIDKSGSILSGILNAVAPVCGGINLEYYFSKIDNYRLGAGTKLPHNVMGLIGVANGMDGDLRTGLPRQMINIHDPIRLLVIVEHFPDDVIKVLKMNVNTLQWFENEWIHLVVMHPESKAFFEFKKGEMNPYYPITQEISTMENEEIFYGNEKEDLPVLQIIA
jgi:uncharacterized protein